MPDPGPQGQNPVRITGLDHSWEERSVPGRPGSASIEPPNPAGLIWSQGWSRTRSGRWAARSYLLVLIVVVVGTIAEALWTQFRRPYFVVTYHAVIERLAEIGDQMVSVEVEVIDGFTNPNDAQQFSKRLSSALASSRARPGSMNSPAAYPVMISTRARLSPLCDQELVMCQFHDQTNPVIQGAKWRPSRLDLAALQSENLANGYGSHR